MPGTGGVPREEGVEFLCEFEVAVRGWGDLVFEVWISPDGGLVSEEALCPIPVGHLSRFDSPSSGWI